MTTNYGNNSIEALSEVQSVRRSPENFLGSKGIEGARHTIGEIVANSNDEAESGYGDLIEIDYYEDNTISVRDYGRGVPLGYNDKHACYNWHVIFNRRDGGGKYGTNQELLAQVKDWSTFNPKDYNYLFSVGIFGVGASVTQFTSDFMTVESYRDGIRTVMKFENGMPVVPDHLTTLEQISNHPPFTEHSTEKRGTRVTWRPSSEVFYETYIGLDYLKELCLTTAHVSNVSLKLTYHPNEGEVQVFDFPKQELENLLHGTRRKKSSTLGKPIHLKGISHGETRTRTTEGIKTLIYVMDYDITIQPVSSGGRMLVYHNGAKMKLGGSQEKGILTAIFQTVKSTLDMKRIKVEDVLDYFDVIVQTKTNHTDYNGADKSYVSTQFIENDLYTLVLNKLMYEIELKHSGLNTVLESVKATIEARLAYEARRKQVAEITRQTKKADPAKIEKFAPDKLYVKRKYGQSELYIVEGDSAGEQTKKARDIQFQSVLPTTGKPSNARKRSDVDIIKSERKRFMSDFLKINGAGVNIPSMPEESNYDRSKERFDKIVLLMDADIDGQHIRSTLISNLSQLAPDLLAQGKVYICIAPLYRIKFNDGVKKFARNIVERDEIIANYSKGVSEITRLKGIGEMDIEDVAETCMNPETRRLIQIKCNPWDEEFMLNMVQMFGSKVTHRRRLFSLILGLDIDQTESELEELEELIEDDDNLVDDLLFEVVSLDY